MTKFCMTNRHDRHRIDLSVSLIIGKPIFIRRMTGTGAQRRCNGAARLPLAVGFNPWRYGTR